MGDHLQDVREDTAVRVVGAAEFHTSLVDLNLTEAHVEENNMLAIRYSNTFNILSRSIEPKLQLGVDIPKIVGSNADLLPCSPHAKTPTK